MLKANLAAVDSLPADGRRFEVVLDAIRNQQAQPTGMLPPFLVVQVMDAGRTRKEASRQEPEPTFIRFILTQLSLEAKQPASLCANYDCFRADVYSSFAR